MTTEQFFQAVSGAVRGDWFEVLALILLIAASAGYLFWRLRLRPWLDQRRRTREMYLFLRQRHNISDDEWQALESAARRVRLRPLYLLLISEPQFLELRGELLHELNDDLRVDELHYKLFLK